MPVDPVGALYEHGGVARVSTLAREGVSRRAVMNAIRRGEIRRVDRGTYALPATHQAHIAAVSAKAYMSHATAAAFWGLDLIEPAGIHLFVPAGSTRRFEDAIIHRVLLPPGDVDTRLVPVTTVQRTLVDCARSLPFTESLVIADSALRKGLTDERALRRAAAATRGPGARKVRRVLNGATGLAASVAESLLRSIFYADRRLPRPEVQYEVRAGRSLIAQVDLAIPRYNGRLVKLAVEVDGYDFHSSRADYRRDRYRRNELARQGWAHLAVTYEDARHNRGYVADLVLDTLEIRGATAQRVS